MSKLLNSHAVR